MVSRTHLCLAFINLKSLYIPINLSWIFRFTTFPFPFSWLTVLYLFQSTNAPLGTNGGNDFAHCFAVLYTVGNVGLAGLAVLLVHFKHMSKVSTFFSSLTQYIRGMIYPTKTILFMALGLHVRKKLTNIHDHKTRTRRGKKTNNNNINQQDQLQQQTYQESR